MVRRRKEWKSRLIAEFICESGKFNVYWNTHKFSITKRGICCVEVPRGPTCVYTTLDTMLTIMMLDRDHGCLVINMVTFQVSFLLQNVHGGLLVLLLWSYRNEMCK